MGGGFLYWVLCLISPPPGKPYQKVLMGEDVIDGEISPTLDTGSEEYGKNYVQPESKEL